MPLDILLLNPRATDYPKIQQKSYAPLNLLYIAACLEQDGHRVRISDLNATLIDDAEVERVIDDARADIYAFPYFSEIAAHCLWLTELCRKANPNALIVMGGPGASPIPIQCLEQFPRCDAIVRGEGEWTMKELASRVGRGESLRECLGVTYRDAGGELVHNDHRPVETDLDALPMPARHLVSDIYGRGEYYALLEAERPVGGIVTSRGCPFSCGFCYNTVKRYRMRSPEHIVDELAYLSETLKVRFVEFNDILFTANKRRAERVFELLIREKLPIRFAFKARAPEISDDFVKLAKAAGAVQIGFGVESGVQEMLDRMMKKTTVEQCARGIEIVLRHAPADTGLPVWIYTGYAHLDRMPELEVGQRVGLGEVIGPTGNSGVGGRRHQEQTNRRPAIHFSAFSNETGKYGIHRGVVIPVDGRWTDPIALYRQMPPLDSHALEALPEGEKGVPIPVMFEDGTVYPAGTSFVWPYMCARG